MKTILLLTIFLWEYNNVKITIYRRIIGEKIMPK